MRGPIRILGFIDVVVVLHGGGIISPWLSYQADLHLHDIIPGNCEACSCGLHINGPFQAALTPVEGGGVAVFPRHVKCIERNFSFKVEGICRVNRAEECCNDKPCTKSVEQE